MGKILVIGPGPALIGEGGELDAAAAEAAQVLRARGHEVVLFTSNPATVSSDPALADRTYLEPLDVAALRAIVLAEKPTAILPAFGGAKALELVLALHEDGTLKAAGAELIGQTADSIALGRADAVLAAAKRAALGHGDTSWTALEVVAAFDATGEFLPLCTIESLDRADVHPGDAIAVTPPLQASALGTAELHEAVRAAIVAAGLHAGIATCEVALRHSDRSLHVLAVSPGASRSTALAAQATGYPAVTVAVDLALGRTLAAIRESGVAPPAQSGVVVRWPRFAFETFPEAALTLGAERKSLGESLGAGVTLADALRRAARGDDGLAVARAVKRGSAQPPRSRESHDTSSPGSLSKRVLVLGPGPSRIGHGPELGTCASEALVAARELGFQPVFMDSSIDSLAVAARFADHVHVEPVTLERVLEVHDRDGAAGVIVQVGGDTALRLAADLVAHGVHVFGTTPAPTAVRALVSSGSRDLDDAIAVDVDAVADGTRVVIAGVMEHLEPAFVHGGDAAMMLPAFTLHPDVIARIEDRVRAIALELRVVGLLSVRLAVLGQEITVVDIEPRAGRTSAFVSRATGFPLVRIAAKVMLGKSLDELAVAELPLPRHVAARERVFPFERLGVDPALGREMRSTGEVIGLDDTPARAYAKALRGMGISLQRPAAATGAHGVLLSVSDQDRTAAVDLARRFRAVGFEVVALGGIRAALTAARIPFRDGSGAADDLTQSLDDIRRGRIAFAVVTARGDVEIARTRSLRAATLAARIPCFTTMRLAGLGCSALEEDPAPRIRALQHWYAVDD